MAEQDDEQKKRDEELIKTFDEVLEDSRWDRSLFFKNIKKRLTDLRGYLKVELGFDQAAQENTAVNAVAQTPVSNELPTGTIEIYVSLYAAEGTNISRWETILNTIGSHSISRPIYKLEQDIQDAIRGKDYQQNDAYAVVLVQDVEILKPFNNKPPLDKAGRELLVIKEGAIQARNISRFVHYGSEFVYKNARLVKVK